MYAIANKQVQKRKSPSSVMQHNAVWSTY